MIPSYYFIHKYAVIMIHKINGFSYYGKNANSHIMYVPQNYSIRDVNNLFYTDIK